MTLSLSSPSGAAQDPSVRELSTILDNHISVELNKWDNAHSISGELGQECRRTASLDELSRANKLRLTRSFLPTHSNSRTDSFTKASLRVLHTLVFSCASETCLHRWPLGFTRREVETLIDYGNRTTPGRVISCYPVQGWRFHRVQYKRAGRAALQPSLCRVDLPQRGANERIKMRAEFEFWTAV